jgi:DNA polymerase sigma
LIVFIKGARVPIIKCDFELASEILNCDISMSSIDTSFRMSKLFWTYSQLDTRVGPFIFLVRAWARLFRISTDKRPTAHLTNFQLTTLALDYLLRMEKPLIVPLNTISRRDSHGVFLKPNLTVSSIKSTLPQDKNEQSLNSLFLGFLNYYAMFDFDSQVITLDAAMRLKSPEEKTYALHIQNPFEPELNASSNVRIKQLNHFVHCCDVSTRMIETLKSGDGDQFDLEGFFKMALRHAQTIKYDTTLNESNEINDLMNN